MKCSHFSLGQVVWHIRNRYRGVVIDVDALFSGTDSWYEEHALTRPDKQQPWYHVLVDNEERRTYVAESNLCPDASDSPVEHPYIEHFLYERAGGYHARVTLN